MQFYNRSDAGKKLASKIMEEGVEADLVLAIPRGGLPIGRQIADALNASLDVVGVSKIGTPANPELAAGAVTGDGSYCLNEETIQKTGIDSNYIEEAIHREAENAARKEKHIRRKKPAQIIKGKNVIVVDDGLATGATAKAALRKTRKMEAKTVTFAAPVAPENTTKNLQEEADRVIILQTPKNFASVSQFYEEFPQLSYEQARKYLEKQ